MRNKLTTAVMVAVVAAALIGGGVALGATTNHAVKACSRKTTHVLGLLKNGKCAKGSTEVTLGAQGARGLRGARGPAGPGAVSDTLTVGNNDELVQFPETIDGMKVSTSCGMGSSVMISLAPTSGTMDASGTDSADGSLTAVDAFEATNVGRTGANQADIDVVASTDGTNFVQLEIHGTWVSDACHYWMVEVPATPAAH